MYGPLYYKWLDMDKSQALKIHKENFDKTMDLSSQAKFDLNWWVNSTETAYNVVCHGESYLTMTTDASKIRWGCTVQDTPTVGHWTPEEVSMHINFLEIKSVLLGLQLFEKMIAHTHVKLLVDMH